MITAIYRRREDGDADFVCAFDSELDETAQWVSEIKEFLENDGEEVVVTSLLGTSRLIDVLAASKARSATESSG